MMQCLPHLSLQSHWLMRALCGWVLPIRDTGVWVDMVDMVDMDMGHGKKIWLPKTLATTSSAEDGVTIDSPHPPSRSRPPSRPSLSPGVLERGRRRCADGPDPVAAVAPVAPALLQAQDGPQGGHVAQGCAAPQHTSPRPRRTHEALQEGHQDGPTRRHGSAAARAAAENGKPGPGGGEQLPRRRQGGPGRSGGDPGRHSRGLSPTLTQPSATFRGMGERSLDKTQEMQEIWKAWYTSGFERGI